MTESARRRLADIMVKMLQLLISLVFFYTSSVHRNNTSITFLLRDLSQATALDYCPSVSGLTASSNTIK